MHRVVDKLRHAVLTCGYTSTIDRAGTLHSATRAVCVARALAMMLMGVLCIVLISPTAYAVDLLNVRAYAAKAIDNPKEFKCFDYIITRESHWNPLADNPRSTAYGIGQMLGEKSKDPFTQLAKVLRYAKHRYSSMCHAMAFHIKRGWW